MGKGKRLYVCQDCKEQSFFHWTAFERASRARCPSCGSTWLDPKTDEAVEEQADKATLRKEKENAKSSVLVLKKDSRGNLIDKGIKW